MGDLLVYDPVAMAWTDLSAAASGTPPAPRGSHGFAAAGGRLYVHGGYSAQGAAVAAACGPDHVRASAWRQPPTSVASRGTPERGLDPHLPVDSSLQVAEAAKGGG